MQGRHAASRIWLPRCLPALSKPWAPCGHIAPDRGWTQPDHRPSPGWPLSWPSAKASRSTAPVSRCRARCRRPFASRPAGKPFYAPTWSELQVNDRVNLERALRLSDRLGGHLVRATLRTRAASAAASRQGDWELVWFTESAELAAQMVARASVAVDGISMTLVDGAPMASASPSSRTRWHTRRLAGNKPARRSTWRPDLLAKYVWKCLQGLSAFKVFAKISMTNSRSMFRRATGHWHTTKTTQPLRIPPRGRRCLTCKASVAERGIRPKNKLGQNFLIDLNLIDLTRPQRGASAGDLAVEIGGHRRPDGAPADHAGAVLTVENRPGLATSFHRKPP